MTIFEVIVLGIIQGATEFLPISSDGHLVLLPTFFNMPTPDLAMVGILHLGTLLAMSIYFWRDIWQIATAVLQGLRQKEPLGTADARLGWLIAVGSIPAVVVGLFLKDWLESMFASPAIGAFFLLVTAVLLVIGEKMQTGGKRPFELGWGEVFFIGLLQASALLPGVSRSGSTIAGGRMRGLDRPTATRFAFLLGFPAIFGAGMLSLVEVLAEETSYGLDIYLVGFLTAAAVGYFCIHFLLNWVRSHTLYPFAIYCVLLGGGYLLYTAVVA